VPMNRRAERLKPLPLRTVVTLLGAIAALAVVRAQGRPPVRAFTGARVFDGSDRAPLENAILIVRDGRIEAVGPAGRITVPDGAERVSVAGKWIIPGLVNAH